MAKKLPLLLTKAEWTHILEHMTRDLNYGAGGTYGDIDKEDEVDTKELKKGQAVLRAINSALRDNQ